jgi:hypothetical protein
MGNLKAIQELRNSIIEYIDYNHRRSLVSKSSDTWPTITNIKNHFYLHRPPGLFDIHIDDVIDDLESEKLIEITDGRVTLTQTGKDYVKGMLQHHRNEKTSGGS